MIKNLIKGNNPYKNPLDNQDISNYIYFKAGFFKL